jgi:hypothetical protein
MPEEWKQDRLALFFNKLKFFCNETVSFGKIKTKNYLTDSKLSLI